MELRLFYPNRIKHNTRTWNAYAPRRILLLINQSPCRGTVIYVRHPFRGLFLDSSSGLKVPATFFGRLTHIFWTVPTLFSRVCIFVSFCFHTIVIVSYLYSSYSPLILRWEKYSLPQCLTMVFLSYVCFFVLCFVMCLLSRTGYRCRFCSVALFELGVSNAWTSYKLTI